MKKIYLIIFLLSLTANSAQACDCALTTLLEKYQQSNLIFLGTVNDINITDNPLNDSVNFKIIKSWKQTWYNQNVSNFTYKNDGTDCDYRFKKGKKYLVFGINDKQKNPNISICSGVFEIKDDNDKNIEWLNLGEKRGY